MVPPSLDMHDITTMDLGYKYNLKFTKALEADENRF